MKPRILKAAGSGINEIIFSSFSWRYMFIIHRPGLDKYCARCTTSMPIYSCVHQKILCIQSIYVCLFLHCILLFVGWVPLVFLDFLQHTTRIVLWNVFILEIENSLTLPCIKLCVTGISLREDVGLCKMLGAILNNLHL